jgi:hypothetical protein
MQSLESIASTDGTHLKEKGLHISAHQKEPTFWIPLVGSTNLRGATLFIEISQVRTGLLIQKL